MMLGVGIATVEPASATAPGTEVESADLDSGVTDTGGESGRDTEGADAAGETPADGITSEELDDRTVDGNEESTNLTPGDPDQQGDEGLTTGPKDTAEPETANAEVEAAPEVEPLVSAASAANISAMRAEIVRRTNELRAQQGRPALKTDPRTDSVAQTWSLQQAKLGLMHHNPLLKVQIPAGWSYYGENVAYGQSTAKKVVDAWWNSPGHKANMLKAEFTHIGVGVAYSSRGKPYYTQVFVQYKNGLAKPGVFTDVSPGAPFYKEIAWMLESGLSTGVATPAGKAYQPKNMVSREAMAAFLYRLKTPKGQSAPAGYKVPASSPFADVPRGHKFYKEIAWMSESGISTGTAQGSGKPKYDPKTAVSREAMAAFLFRMEQESAYRAPSVSRFADVRTNHKFYRQISWMYDTGLSTGVKQPAGKPKYQPGAGVSREAMAAFIYRLEH